LPGRANIAPVESLSSTRRPPESMSTQRAAGHTNPIVAGISALRPHARRRFFVPEEMEFYLQAGPGSGLSPPSGSNVIFSILHSR
jgi:hypothetical protein